MYIFKENNLFYLIFFRVLAKKVWPLFAYVCFYFNLIYTYDPLLFNYIFFFNLMNLEKYILYIF